MNRNSFGWSLLLLLLLSVCVPAQSVRKASIESPHVGVASVPFMAGETLTYEGKLNRMPMLFPLDVADLSFTVANLPQAADQSDKLRFEAEAVSKGGLLKLFRVSFLQRMQTTVDTINFRALQTVRHDEQGKRVREGEAVFDYAIGKVTYREVDPTNLAKPARMIASPLEAPVQDLLSAIYYLRRQPLAVGKSFEIPVSESGVVYRIPVNVTAREQQKTVLGKVWAFRLEPEIFGDKRLIQDEGKMALWITDDERRVPVRAQIQASIGKVEIKLRSAQGLKSLK